MNRNTSCFVRSPLNFQGTKFACLDEILAVLPWRPRLLDVFGGGFTVGVNAPHAKVVYNDSNPHLARLFSAMSEGAEAFASRVREHAARYGVDGPMGRETYLCMRSDWNASAERDPALLYLLVTGGFQQQVRFNSKGDFNNPPGNRWLNPSLAARLDAFCGRLASKAIEFRTGDALELLAEAREGDAAYLDPPYGGTRAAYNDGRRGYGGAVDEDGVVLALEGLEARGVPWVLSYSAAPCRLGDWARGHASFKVLDGLGRYGRRPELLAWSGT